MWGVRLVNADEKRDGQEDNDDTILLRSVLRAVKQGKGEPLRGALSSF